jgi:hypothetical protein
VRPLQVDLSTFERVQRLRAIVPEFGSALILCRVVIAARKVLLAFLQLLARVLLLGIVAALRLVDLGVEHLLLPAVVASAVALQGTSLLVFANEVAGLPLFANLKGIVSKVMGLSPEILPIVRVNALRLIMFLVVRAPLRLEVVHVEIGVPRHLVDQRSFDIIVRMRERAILLVFAVLLGLRAKLGFVAFDVVQTFHLVVRLLALVVLAVLLFAKVHTVVDLRCTPPLVQQPVVVGAVLGVVGAWVRAADRLKPLEVHVAAALGVHVPQFFL